MPISYEALPAGVDTSWAKFGLEELFEDVQL